MNSNISCNIGTKKFIRNYDWKPQKETMNLTSIIIVTYNQLEYTKLCIESIRKFTPENTYEIIVVDNNSTDNTVRWLEKQSDIRTIYNDKNNGFPIGCNQGIKIALGDNILLLNNDVIVTPNWLNNLYRALYSKEEIGAVGAVSNNCSNLQQINVFYNGINEMINFAKENNISNEDMWENREKLIGYCLMIKKSILNKIGLLDERFTPGNFEDDDISYRILLQGYKLLLCRDVFIHHFGSVSFKTQMNEYTKLFYKNKQKFDEKWGFDSGKMGKIRFENINLIQEKEDSKFNVLEIGCGIGATLLQIKNIYRNSEIYGIEISEKAGNIGKYIGDVVIGDVETIEIPFEKKSFDYIILQNILEDLKNPWEVLNKISQYLKDGGYIITTIANAMHYTCIKNLMFGSFKYDDSQVIKKQTLRLFTILDIQDLLLKEGFKVEFATGFAMQPTLDDEKFINSLVSMTNETLRQQYTIYEYLIKAKLDKWDGSGK